MIKAVKKPLALALLAAGIYYLTKKANVLKPSGGAAPYTPGGIVVDAKDTLNPNGGTVDLPTGYGVFGVKKVFI